MTIKREEPFFARNDDRRREALSLKTNGTQLIDRKISSDTFEFHDSNHGKSQSIRLRESARLALSTYQVLDLSQEAAQLESLLRVVHFYRKADLGKLKTLGSPSSHQTLLEHRGRNLWSVLRNLHDRRDFDERYNIIMKFMKKSFPRFDGLFIEQTGPQSVYGHAFQKALRQPIPAFGMSDGQLQMLIHLTALFCEGRDHQSLILFDEPETSLHPYALAVFAEAVELATTEWNKQVLIASHSPVLISQFEPENVFAVELGAAGQTIITRVSEMSDIQDLLDEKYQLRAGKLSEVTRKQLNEL
ncbi:MAG: AAA family ATPase [Ardenticatenaceae bacterium]